MNRGEHFNNVNPEEIRKYREAGVDAQREADKASTEKAISQLTRLRASLGGSHD